MIRLRRRNQEQTMEALIQKLDRLERIVEELMNQKAQPITIEKMVVHNPVLEKLEFRLDKLDIRELSGALNMGNNFGVQVEKKPNDQVVMSKKEEKNSPGEQGKEVSATFHDTQTILRTKNGYRFRFQQKS